MQHSCNKELEFYRERKWLVDRPDVLELDIGLSEAKTFRTGVLRKLARRGVHGVKLVISDAYGGTKALVAMVMTASWQGCRVHFMRSVLAHAGRSGPRP
ncbi:hypothetical protein EOE48_25050 [Methylobacterium oryzihabitans]|uniref:Mutator family transposase n=1 Tax=Methylobacterium oryzihabitans TaxID=2499852 RepID=A0A3S2VIZ2_9HYPH|nr:hypothetical protein EOE48_25050 [Methylobacterium oryzihabitans]